MTDVHPSPSQPQGAVQLHLGPGLLQRIICASEKGSCLTLRLEDAEGVLTVGNSQYRLGVEADREAVIVRVPDGSDQSNQGSLAVVRQKLRLQVAATAQTVEQEHADAQQPEIQELPKQQPPRSEPSPGKEAVPHSKAPESKGPSSAHASSAKRVGSGSPPPWAHLAGPNAVFRPAVGSREPTPPAASVPTPKPSAAPARHSTAPAKAPAGQPREPPPSTVSQGSDSAQAAVREPSKQNGALGCSRGGTPEPRLQSQPPPKHAADQPRTAQPRQQRLPQHASDRSHAGTPEPPGQAPKQPAGQPVPPHTHTGKPPLRPASGSSRDPTPDEARPSSKGGTPDSVDLSSSSGPSSLKSSRDNTPQPGTGSQPLSRPNPLGRPGSAPTLPGAATQVGHGPSAKVMKKTRKLLGKKGAAKKKTGQSMEDGRDMDIPVAALVGARKGLVYCLVGLIAHKRYSSKSLTKSVAEVARRVKDMRNPSSEHLREQALKIAEYKSPGMWVLMDRYQKFADELKAEADQAASLDQAAPAMPADATPEPEAPAANKALHSRSATGKPRSKANDLPDTHPAKQPPALAKQQAQLQRKPKLASLSRLAQGEGPKEVRAAAPEQQHRAPSKKRQAPERYKRVEISDTDSEREQPASKRHAYGGRLSVTPDAGILHPSSSPSPRPAQLSEPPIYKDRPSAIAEAAHLRPTPSPTPTPAPWKGPAKSGGGDPTLPCSTSMPGSSPLPQPVRPQTPSELQTSHEADDTWYAEHSRREPVRHPPVGSSEQAARYVEEYDVKHEDYLQIHQAIRRTQRYVSAIELGYQAAKTKHEEDWYNQQADRLGKRVQPLMQHWCSAYKVLHEELQDIKDRLEEYHQQCASGDLDVMADD